MAQRAITPFHGNAFADSRRQRQMAIAIG